MSMSMLHTLMLIFLHSEMNSVILKISVCESKQSSQVKSSPVYMDMDMDMDMGMDMDMDKDNMSMSMCVLMSMSMCLDRLVLT